MINLRFFLAILICGVNVSHLTQQGMNFLLSTKTDFPPDFDEALGCDWLDFFVLRFDLKKLFLNNCLTDFLPFLSKKKLFITWRL